MEPKRIKLEENVEANLQRGVSLESQNIELLEKLDRLKRENKEKEEQIIRLTKENEYVLKEMTRERKYAARAGEVLANIKSKEPSQIVYVATSKDDAQKNIFKIGGVSEGKQLRGRLATYNSGRTGSGKMYYAAWWYCHDFRHLEKRIEYVAGQYRVKGEQESYNLHFDAVVEIVQFMCDRYNEEVDKYKHMFDELIRDTLDKPPVVPEEKIINGAEHRNFRNSGSLGTVLVYWDSKNEEEKYELVLQHLELFIEAQRRDGVVGSISVPREQFELYLSEKHKWKFSKRALWAKTKFAYEEIKKTKPSLAAVATLKYRHTQTPAASRSSSQSQLTEGLNSQGTEERKEPSH